MLLALTLVAAPIITTAEAQTLPVAEVARRVLGPAGAVAIDVERPRWPTCEGLCPPPVPRPDGPPPFRQLTFYTRAGAVAEAGWLGLCRASRIVVHFDAQGAVESVGQGQSIGWLGALTARVPVDGPNSLARIEAQRADFNARCRALPTTRAFVADIVGPVEGDRVVVAVALINRSLVTGGPIRVTCEGFNGVSCATAAGRRDLAGLVSVEAMTGFQRVDTKGNFITGGPLEQGCYAVHLAQPFGLSDSLDLCIRMTGDMLSVTRARFNRAMIVY